MPCKSSIEQMNGYSAGGGCARTLWARVLGLWMLDKEVAASSLPGKRLNPLVALHHSNTSVRDTTSFPSSHGSQTTAVIM